MPAHRISAQLRRIGGALGQPVQAVIFPWLITVYFKDARSGRTEAHVVQNRDGLSLSKLADLHRAYARAVRGERVDPAELDALLARPPLYGFGMQCVFSFVGTGALCALAYGGSFIDSMVSGFLAMVVTALQHLARHRDSMYANTQEQVASCQSLQTSPDRPAASAPCWCSRSCAAR
jgi:uncharacterized membrane protein YjjP (DUF1212 family)